MIAIKSQEVINMRELHIQEPELYTLAKTDYVWCNCDCMCRRTIEVLAKKAKYTEWTCLMCTVVH